MVQRFIFDPDINIRYITLVGLGGTGSQLARSVCRIIYDMRARNLSVPNITFVDPDIVEAKNVGRQMFAAADIGRYKAEVLARRFSAALGLEIAFYNRAFDARLHTQSRSQTLLLGAVDNHQARKALSEADCLWVDAGNHYASGQVIIGNTRHKPHVWAAIEAKLEDRPKLAKLSRTTTTRFLPNAALLFPQLLKADRSKTKDLSCAELIQLGEQHLLINDMIADVASQYVYKLMHRQPINSFVTYVDANELNMRSVPITVDDLAAYIGPPAAETPRKRKRAS
jgi:PRTRC genetic system ThiF family protein